MIRRKDDLKVTVNENMRGGEGSVKLEAILSPEEMYNKGRLFSKITIKPGCSIGYHVHEKEMETFYVINGKGEYNDNNGEKTVLHVGDTSYTPSGHGHSVKNTGETDLEILALIVFE